MEIIHHRTNDGVRHGLLVATGRKFMQCIFFDPKPLTIKRIPLDGEKFTTGDASKKDVQKFKDEAKAHGCTKAVAQALGIKATKTKAKKTVSQADKPKGPTTLAKEAFREIVAKKGYTGAQLREKEGRDTVKAYMREKSPDAAQATINTQFALLRKELES